MITLQLTDDQANLMAHILQEMPYKHAAPLMDALRMAVARSQQPGPQFESSPRVNQAPPPPLTSRRLDNHVDPETGESYAELTPPPKANPPPKGMRIAKS